LAQVTGISLEFGTTSQTYWGLRPLALCGWTVRESDFPLFQAIDPEVTGKPEESEKDTTALEHA
jgi:hypothetical protein